ncbi:MAG TPA: hypothetical protein VFP91_03205 [Vicinamibacterales bacterium]|nr:hypothetical protein [Vicinamibacterales bacterium]
MTRSTALPACTAAPAAGFWLITKPAATVLLLTAETSSKTNPAAINADLAAVGVLPTTSGIFANGGGLTAGPSDTTRSTEVPACADAPPLGLWLITKPAATVLLLAVETVPTTNPAAVNVDVAAACAMPTTFGTGVVTGG